MISNYTDIHTFDHLIEFENGKVGTESRVRCEENAQLFIISETLKEAEKGANLFDYY